MTGPFKHENVIKIAGALGVAPELRLAADGNAVATLIVYTKEAQAPASQEGRGRCDVRTKRRMATRQSASSPLFVAIDTAAVLVG